MPLKTPESILANCKRVASGCLEWQGPRSKDGYGVITHAGHPWNGHRLMWHLTRGRLESSKQFVLHKCDNPPCLDPDHMFLGTAKDNALDASSKGRSTGMQKTHCKNGHEFTPENTILQSPRPGKLSNGRRFCRSCHRERCRINSRKYAAQKKARQALERAEDTPSNKAVTDGGAGKPEGDGK